MAKITTLFEDREMQNALYPRTKVSAISDDDNVGLQALLNNKQDELIPGTNIKTINEESLLGGGNIEIPIGCGIDSSNELCNINAGTIEYTATEDCFVYVKKSSSPTLKVDGNIIDTDNPVWFPMKKGSTVTHTTTGSGKGTIKAWGIKK